MMLGRSIEASFPPLSTVPDGPPLVEVKALAWDGALTDISASVRRGEIVGIGGLDGQGQHELLLALFGALKGVEGDIRLSGTTADRATPARRTRHSPTMAYVPEDRGTLGLAQQMSIGDNILLASKSGYLADFLRPPGHDSNRLAAVMEKLKIKASSPRQAAFTLSGGNQQKVVLAKWLLDRPDILLLDDPTRGIDVGTKQEIFILLQELVEAGCAIFLYSSDYQELANCCHRVLVFYEGRVSHELTGPMLTENNLINAAFNLPLQQAGTATPRQQTEDAAR
jgi:ribose transport system ATP-binding protein